MASRYRVTPAAPSEAQAGSNWARNMIGQPMATVSSYGLARAWRMRASTGQVPGVTKNFGQAAARTAEAIEHQIWDSLSSRDQAAIGRVLAIIAENAPALAYLRVRQQVSPLRQQDVATYLHMNMPVLGQQSGELNYLLRVQAHGGAGSEEAGYALAEAWQAIAAELHDRGAKVTGRAAARLVTVAAVRAAAGVKAWANEQAAVQPAGDRIREPEPETGAATAASPARDRGRAMAAADPGLVAAARARLGLTVDEFASFLTEQTGFDVIPSLLSYWESEGERPGGEVQNACLDVLADKPGAHPMTQRHDDVIDIRALLAAKHKEARPAVLQDARWQLGLTEKEFAQAMAEWERSTGSSRKTTDSQDIRDWEEGKYPHGLSEHISTVVALMEGRQPPPPESEPRAQVIGLKDHQVARASVPALDDTNWCHGPDEDAEADGGFEAG